jgi:peptide/nickel transport system permease protein
MNERLQNFWKLVTFNIETKVGFVIVAAFMLTALIEGILGNLILPYDPVKAFVGPPFSPPSLFHPFGTEELGRDLFSRIIAGTSNDAIVSIAVIAFAFLVGGILGSMAGYKGGLMDELLMRVTDVFFVIPGLILAIVIVTVLGPSILNLTIALAVLWWPPYARLARSEALRLANAHFVESAKLSGLSTTKIMFRHIFRLASTTLLVYATLDIGTVVLAYSGLAFLGFSVSPPAPDWGVMVAQYEQYIFLDPWLPLIPAIVIVAVVVGFSLLGDGLKAALQQQRGR